MSLTIVTLRNDLRLHDHPALASAACRGPILPVFIWDPDEHEAWAPGSCSRWWLHHSLSNLTKSLAVHELPLIIRAGNRYEQLQQIIQATGADAVYWNRRYEPAARSVDQLVQEKLSQSGIKVETFNGTLLREPWETLKGDHTPYRMFTPFWKARLKQGHALQEASLPNHIAKPTRLPSSLTVDQLELLPPNNWHEKIAATWRPGETDALAKLETFVTAVHEYADRRNSPGEVGTSRLSPHLHFGEISPRRILNAVSTRRSTGLRTYLSELGWREFSYYLMYHFPDLPEQPMKKKFAAFPWKDDPVDFDTWRHGRTGYPMVDAGMRELWHTGWMHNRVRMIAASFLVKHLRVNWRKGGRWFWDTLVDADLAANTMGWQWTAGCGADAAPYFRIFNPVLQGEKFDPQGEYVRMWCPELSDLPDKWIHKPWEAPEQVLADAQLRLGKDYPSPIVDHSEARDTALALWETIK